MRPDSDRLEQQSKSSHLIGRLISTVAILLLLAAIVTFAAPLLEPQLEHLLESGDWRTWAIAAGVVLTLVLGPLLMLARIWRRRQPAAEPSQTDVEGLAADTLPRRKPLQEAPWGCVVGPAVFLLVGLGFLLIFALPAIKVVKARFWPAVECEILASSVATHSGDDGATYSVEVTYRYAVDGVEYTASRYRFLGGSSSGRKGKQRVVDALQPGTVTTCWVDPEDPTQAVLDRNPSWHYAFALFPLVFVVLGAVGLVIGLRARALSKNAEVGAEQGIEAAVASLGGPQSEDVLPDIAPGEKLLEPAASPLGKLVGITLVALFWNGIVGIFVWQLIKSPEWFLGCFLVPFVLVGMLLLVGIPYQLLALANPKPHLRLADGRLRPGGETNLYWSFTGATRRLRSLKIELVGSEKVTYRSGDSTSTSTSTLARVPLVNQAQRGLLAQGNVLVEIPAGAMHSFKGRRNKITWAITLHGQIAGWPDVSEEFEVMVLPERTS